MFFDVFATLLHIFIHACLVEVIEQRLSMQIEQRLSMQMPESESEGSDVDVELFCEENIAPIDPAKAAEMACYYVGPKTLNKQRGRKKANTNRPVFSE